VLIGGFPSIDLEGPAHTIERQLAAMADWERTLLAASRFNDEFENGGVPQFFYNSEGAIAPEVRQALLDLGLTRQAGILARGIAMFGMPYVRDTQRRRERFFHNHDGWSDFDRGLAALTDDFYALDGGPTVVRIDGQPVIDGGPGIRDAMLAFAGRRQLLPC
jgi:hypothetical protein